MKEKSFTLPNFFKKNLGGFTLIELLVVIAVIGLLASIVLVSMGSVRMKARDAKRKENLRQIQIALELRYANTENYPSMSCLESPWWNCWGEPNWTCGGYPNSLKCYLVEAKYLPSMPRDPKFRDSGQACAFPDDSLAFYYHSDGSRYFLCVRLEDSSDPTAVPQASRPGCADYCTYFIGNWYTMPPI